MNAVKPGVNPLDLIEQRDALLFTEEPAAWRSGHQMCQTWVDLEVFEKLIVLGLFDPEQEDEPYPFDNKRIVEWIREYPHTVLCLNVYGPRYPEWAGRIEVHTVQVPGEHVTLELLLDFADQFISTGGEFYYGADHHVTVSW